MHKAIGLSTLKEQQQHVKRVLDQREPPRNIMDEQRQDSRNDSNAVEIDVTNVLPVNITTKQSQAMEHGVKNDINAVEVVVTKVLPVYAPYTSFFEEGCYYLPNGRDGDSLVINPDGSCRNKDKPTIAIEIKCPVPGKKYSPDVHYKISEYYVCQILSEMKALDCKHLLYTCWSPQSCTVMRAQFEENLWALLLEEVDALFPQEGKPIILKLKRENAAILKAKIKEYTEECVELLAEFPSCNSSVCTHTGKTYQIENARGYHASPPNRDSSVKQTYARLTKIGQTIMRTVKCIEEMYDVLRTPGKEVLVTLLSDMDRMKQSEHAHAIPIAYGLSGYSLKVEVIRSMVAEITTACTEQGLKVVAVSSDGQFYK